MCRTCHFNEKNTDSLRSLTPCPVAGVADWNSRPVNWIQGGNDNDVPPRCMRLVWEEGATATNDGDTNDSHYLCDFLVAEFDTKMARLCIIHQDTNPLLSSILSPQADTYDWAPQATAEPLDGHVGQRIWRGLTVGEFSVIFVAPGYKRNYRNTRIVHKYVCIIIHTCMYVCMHVLL